MCTVVTFVNGFWVKALSSASEQGNFEMSTGKTTTAEPAFCPNYDQNYIFWPSKFHIQMIMWLKGWLVKACSSLLCIILQKYMKNIKPELDMIVRTWQGSSVARWLAHVLFMSWLMYVMIVDLKLRVNVVYWLMWSFDHCVCQPFNVRLHRRCGSSTEHKSWVRLNCSNVASK